MPTKQKRGLKTVYLTAATMITLLLCLDTHAQDPVINLIHGNMRAKAYIDSIEKVIKVGYSAEQIDTAAYIHAPGPVRLSKALQLLMDTFHLKDTFMGNPRQVYLRFAPAETKTPPPPVSYPTHLTLTVTTESGRPLPSANLKDSLSGFTYHTSENGTVLIKSSQKQVFLIVTYVGMNPQRVTIRGHVSRTIRLHDGSSVMDEKIVTNYGMGTRRNSTTDITTAPRNLIDAVSTLTSQTALEGIVPGLLVTQTSGVPGASAFLTIRGQNSIYNNCDPLYVIDGVIFAPGNQSMLNLSVGNSGNSLSPFSFIPTSEFEKIDVLKDADATAIYGSRGANGVILITTQRYKSSRPRFTLQYASGISAVANPIKLLNTPQYLRMRHDAFNYDAQYGDSITPATAPDLLSLDTTRYTNWVKNLLGGVGHTNNIQLAFNQASELDAWHLDLTGFRETSVFPTTPIHERANTCLNFDHHNQKNTWSIHLTGLGGVDDNQQFILLDPTNFIFLAPDAPALRNPDGSLNLNPYFLNPLSILEQTYKATSHNYLGSAQFKYNPFSWLTLRTELGFNSTGNHEVGQMPISAQQPTATIYFARTSYTSRIIEPQAEVKQQWGRLATGFLLGYSWQDEKAALNTLTDTSNKEETDSTYPAMHYQYRAWFARLNFNYDDIFILNLTGRRDGSSRFGPGIRYADFYAVGAAFLFSRFEAVRNTLPWLSLGKLRGSIGVTGNDQIGDHRLQGYTPVNEPSFDNIPGYFSSSQVAVGTSWETIHKEELALDLGFAGDRFLLTVARYKNQSTDQLLPVSYPGSGVPDVFRNWPAVLQNKGWEFNLTARIVDEKDFSWSMGVNWTLPVNTLKSFPDLAQTPFAQTLMVGQPLSVVQVRPFTGVDPTSGLFTFGDSMVLGHFDATGFGGLHTDLRYKHIGLLATMDARHTMGNNYLTTLYINNPPGSNLYGLMSNAPAVLTRRWEAPEQHAPYQQVTTDLNTPAGREIPLYAASSARLTNASFIRLKILKLSYCVADNTLKHLHLSNLTLYIAGQNLFTFTPYKNVDPEIQNASILPPLRIIEAGFSVGI